MRRHLLLAILGLAGSGTLSAQQAGANDTAALLRGGFAEVSGWASRAAELVPADQYNYRPVPTVRTFGQLVGHLADAYNWYCAQAAGRQVEWSDAIEKSGANKAMLVQQLGQALDRCNAVYAGPGVLKPMLENVGHTSIHYGNMVTYIRMLRLVPPSS